MTRLPRAPLFYAEMWGLTLVGCALVAVAYFAVQGSRLTRVPARITGDWLMERDDEMGFVPTRNGSTEIVYIGSSFRYHVFNDRRSARVNAPGEQAPNPVDVMAVGCSFTWGAGLESDATYIQQLRGLLGVSVANFAMGSYGSVQAFQTLVRNLDLVPKVVVYGFIADHLRRNLSPCAPNNVPYCLPVSYLQRVGDQIVLQPPHLELFSPEDNRAFNLEVAMRDGGGPMAWFLAARWAAKIAWFEQFGSKPVTVDMSPETAAIAFRVIVQAMAKETQKIGARFVVLFMPYLVRGHVQPVPQALSDAIAGQDLTFVDFGAVAQRYYDEHPTGTLIQGDDPHPNALAHRMIAETLADAVRPFVATAR